MRVAKIGVSLVTLHRNEAWVTALFQEIKLQVWQTLFKVPPSRAEIGTTDERARKPRL